MVQVVRANAPTNGIYFGPRGIFASVALLPDLTDKTKNITPNLVRQLISDTFAALLLTVFLAHLPGGVLGRAGWAALAGIVAVVVNMLPYWNWHGSARSRREILDRRAGPRRLDEETGPGHRSRVR